MPFTLPKLERAVKYVAVLIGLMMPVGGAHAFGPDAVPAAFILVDKSDQIMTAYDETGAMIKRYPVGLGRVAGPKEREGDMKTPVGAYLLQPARQSRDWGLFFDIDYPNVHDVKRAQARGQDPRTLGGAIGIHGTGGEFWRGVRNRFGENWTLGCIALRNDDLRDFVWRVRTPIPIHIQP